MSQIQPEGEEIRKAIKWISANLEEGKKKSKLVRKRQLSSTFLRHRPTFF